MKIRLLMLGKTKRAECRALIEDYAARIRHFAPFEIIETREDSAAAAGKVKTGAAAEWVLLDAAGKQLTTPQFAKWLGDLRDRGTRELIFLCGTDHGFPEELRQRPQHRISLSTLTMPHEFARVVLAEQIYRAFTILHGHPYSK